MNLGIVYTVHKQYSWRRNWFPGTLCLEEYHGERASNNQGIRKLSKKNLKTQKIPFLGLPKNNKAIF